MKTRFAAIAVLAVFVVLVSSVPLMSTSDSDALEATYTKYYYNQLTAEQQVIYDALESIDADPVESSDAYRYEKTIDIDEPNSYDARVDVEAAWYALKLDNVYAVATWTKDTLVPSIGIVYDMGVLKSVSITMDPMFAHAKTMCDNAKSAINGTDVSGSDIPAKVKSINSILSGSDYKFAENGATGIYGILGDGPHELSAAGFSAVFKALCMKAEADMNCMQIYGTLADGSKNVVHAWNEVVVDDGEVYAVDSAINNKEGTDAWMLAGRYTDFGGDPFGKVHMAFAFNTSTGIKCDFGTELLCNDGYDWPASNDILDILKENAQWILIGLVCVVLAIYLVVTARKGGPQ